jgi:hypothetical protein
LHRDNFLAKVPGPCPDAASGNTTSLYCRAVRSHEEPVNQLKFDGNFSVLSLDNKVNSGTDNYV